MVKKNLTSQRGFTIIELVIAMLIAIIPIFAIGIILSDSQRGWNSMYERVYSDVVTDSYIARKTFDAVSRKASWERITLAEDGSWIEVYYYANDDSTVLDRYARFYEAEGDLNVEHGNLGTGEILTTQTVCSNVSNCTFKTAGRSVQMILTLDNSEQALTTISSAVMHN
jgi:prepilin-type N-terminal cleavage/methylation domain-containing protein